MKLKKIKISKNLILFSFFCLFFFNLIYAKELDILKINLEVVSEYKILKNAIKSKAQGVISDKEKKSVNGDIFFKKEKFSAKIRLHGDAADHLDIDNLIYSLDISLQNGRIKGIKDFKVLLKKTRPEEEFLVNLSLKNLGYTTPYIENVVINFNGKVYEAYLIEKPNKYMFERMGLRESPIFRGDERIWWDSNIKKNLGENFKYPDHLSFRLVNKSFIKDSLQKDSSSTYSKFTLALAGIDALTDSNIYGFSESYFCSLLQECAYFNIVDKYSPHSNLPNNAILYFDIYSNIFKPIFWDAGQRVVDCKIDESLKISEIQIDYLNAVKKDLEKYNFEFKPEYECIILDIYKIYTENYDKFSLNTKTNNIKTEDRKSLYNNIIWFDVSERKFYSCFSDNFINLRLKNSVPCQKKELPFKNYIKYLSGQYKKNGSFYSFIGTSSKTLVNEIKSLSSETSCKEEICLIEVDGIETLNIENQFISHLKIKLNSKNSRLVLKSNNSQINKIEVFGNWDFDVNINHQITGCLSIIDSNVLIKEIFFYNSFCEDAVNIVNSKGSIDYLNIKNSRFDALDSDFSDIKIKEIRIENAFNDCLDWSFSKWAISSLKLSVCGDKGLSIGEVSNIYLDEDSYIANAFYGAAVKEGSMLKINKKLNIIDFDKSCFETYVKKQYLGTMGEIEGTIICE